LALPGGLDFGGPPFARNNVARGQARIRFARCALVLSV
jgi:hypothetical protein